MPKGQNLQSLGSLRPTVIELVASSREVQAANAWQSHVPGTSTHLRLHCNEGDSPLEIFSNRVWGPGPIQAPPRFSGANLRRCEVADLDGKGVRHSRS